MRAGGRRAKRGRWGVERCYPQWAQPKGAAHNVDNTAFFLAAPTHNVHGLTLVGGVLPAHSVDGAARLLRPNFEDGPDLQVSKLFKPRHLVNGRLRAIMSTRVSVYVWTQSKMVIVLALLILPPWRGTRGV